MKQLLPAILLCSMSAAVMADDSSTDQQAAVTNAIIKESLEQMSRQGVRVGRLMLIHELYGFGRYAFDYWSKHNLQRLNDALLKEIQRGQRVDRAVARIQEHSRQLMRRSSAHPAVYQRHQANYQKASDQRARIQAFITELQTRRSRIPYWQSMRDANLVTHSMEQEIQDTELLLQSSPMRQSPDWAVRTPEAVWQGMPR